MVTTVEGRRGLSRQIGIAFLAVPCSRALPEPTGRGWCAATFCVSAMVRAWGAGVVREGLGEARGACRCFT